MPAVFRHAVRLAVTFALVVSAAWPAVAQSPSARALYQTALARERDARVALAAPDAQSGPTLSVVRSAISAYRRVVGSYPRSGYCDDALWGAAGLATDAFARFAQDRDRATARTVLEQLIREYPVSRFVALARGALDGVGTPGTPPALTIRAVLRTAAPDRVEVSIEAAGRGVMSFTEARLESPPRYYVDVGGARLDPALRNRAWAVDSTLVTQVRVGQQPGSITRIVLDTPDPAGCRARRVADPPRIEITCAAATPGPPPAMTPPMGPRAVVVRPLASRPMAGVLVLPATPRVSAAGASPAGPRVAPPVIPGIGTIAIAPAAPDATAASAALAAALPATPIETMPAMLPAAPAGLPAMAAPPTVVAPPAAAPDIAPAPAPAPAPSPAPTPVPAPARAPVESPLWSLPVDQASVVGLPAIVLPEAPAAAVPLPMGRTLAPVGSAYSAFVPRTPLVQQPAVQVSIASQFTTGDQLRTGGQTGVVPDLGVQLFEPGLAIGNLYADVHITQRDDRAAVGRGVVRLDGFRIGGLVWSIDGGDTWNAPVVQDFGFTNLFAPPVTFQGLSASGSSPRTFMLVSAGRVTTQRNIFGTDTEPIGQRIYQGLFSHRASDRVDVFAHANYIDSREMTLYTPLTDWSTDAGGGIRYRPSATVEVVADAGLSQFLRHGAAGDERTPSGLIGALWSFTRGWAQVNAQRYPIGRFAVYNYPFVDRAGVFASGEVDVGSRARVFGGAEYAISNLDREASADATVGVAPGDGARGYGGVRLSLFDTSMVTLRVDGGGRRIEPSRFGPGFDNNTGVVAMDWHSRFPRGNAFARYERRRYEDPANESSSFTQHDLLAQVYLGIADGRQLFGTLLTSRRADRNGDGQSQWQVGGGAQATFGRVYARVEGTAGRTLSWITQLETSRQALSVGLSSQIARATFVSVDCYVDHTPVLTGTGSPWVTRSMVRVTRMFPFGSSRLSQTGGQTLRSSGPSGRIAGTVFVDWNDNGAPDADEEAVSGVSIRIPGVANVMAGTDGRFVASGVPTGEQHVVVQLDSVPADYDPPAEVDRLVTVERNQTASVAFGMLPLGSFGGLVYQDVDGNGELGPADIPIDGAIVVMDDGSRTEITRGGRFRFDPVRMGTHTANLLIASLPDGSQITGSPTADVELSRGQSAKTIVFLVKVEKRPEIRKVFPPKKK